MICLVSRSAIADSGERLFHRRKVFTACLLSRITLRFNPFLEFCFADHFEVAVHRAMTISAELSAGDEKNMFAILLLLTCCRK